MNLVALQVFRVCLLGLLVAAASPTAAQSLPGIPGLGGSTPKAEPAEQPPSLADWEARLQAARLEHKVLLALPAGSAPLLSPRQFASARRVALLAARVDALKTPVGGSADALQAALPKLSDKPPFDVVEVDALRDRLDALKTQQSALQLGIKQLDVAVEEAIKSRADAEANLRLRRDQRQGAGIDPGRADEQQAALELAELTAQVAQLEVLQSDERRAQTRASLAALPDSIQALEAELGRSRGQLRFDEDDLKRILKGLEVERRHLTAEMAKVSEQLAGPESRASDAASWRVRAALPLRQTLQMLTELEVNYRGQETLWRSRRDQIANPPQPGPAQTILQGITKLIGDLQDQRRRLSAERRLVRSELRAQNSVVAGLPTDAPLLKEEQQVLSALQAKADVQDRLGDALDRATLLLERRRADLGGDRLPTSFEDRAQRAWALIARAAISVWQFELFSATEATSIDGHTVTVDYGVTVGKSVGVVVMLVLGYWAAGRVSKLLIDLAQRRVPMSAQLARVLRRWANSILLLVVLLLVLKVARIPLTAFAFLGGALAIGIGFGAQNVIKNLISGVIILFERKIRVGDVVSIGGMSGTVTTVDLRATTVRGFDGIDAIVPNSNLLENQVSNWSALSPDLRRTVAVAVAYGSDLRKASRLILDGANAHPSMLKEPAAEVLFEEFGANDLTLRLYYWMRLGGVRGGPGVDSDLRFAIANALAAAGIGMAFPQRYVHLDLAGPLQVQLTGGSRPA